MTERLYPEAYVHYLVYFHAERDYFECHEVLEEYWKSLPEKDRVWVGLIQIAVGLYHQRRQNFPGAVKMLESAYLNLAENPQKLESLGLAASETLKLINHHVQRAKRKEAYVSINLPVQDPELLAACQTLCKEKNVTWGIRSNMKDHYLLNKHTLRNRDDVISERERQKVLRSQNRSHNRPQNRSENKS
jgi:uncharacterized protein